MITLAATSFTTNPPLYKKRIIHQTLEPLDQLRPNVMNFSFRVDDLNFPNDALALSLNEVNKWRIQK